MKFFLFFFIIFSCSHRNWYEASRESSGIAPKAEDLKEDIIQVYYARAFAWRGYFGVHPWIAWKKKEDNEYTVTQVTAWNIRSEGKTVSIKKDLPDRKWYDREPTLLLELKGKEARTAIEKVQKIIKDYPYSETYRIWPGPNSNTYISYILREVDELDLELPAHAIGKDYTEKFISNSASNTGFNFSVFGFFGLTAGIAEGLEVNLLGLHFGVDFWTPAIKLPIIGRVGFKDRSLD